VPPDVFEQSAKRKRNDVRIVARKALLQLLEPLVGFILDTGLGIHDLHLITREAAVRTVAARQLEGARRVNISGIAASTGIPRADISRILKSNSGSSGQVTDRQRQATNRILAAWHQDPKFTTPGGKPADLKIYGRGSTFETLVRNHGKGLPTRAMLDELTRTAAAELVPSGLIRVKSLVAVDRGVTPRVIRAFGDRATELLQTMLQNMRQPESPKFVANISGSNVSPAVMPLFRKELALKGADFLTDLHDTLYRGALDGPAKRHPSRASRVSVTIFCHETSRKTKSKKEAVNRRRNLRRGA